MQIDHGLEQETLPQCAFHLQLQSKTIPEK